MFFSSRCLLFFFFNDTATTEIYTLSLHDALPISGVCGPGTPLARPRSAPAGDGAHRGRSAMPEVCGPEGRTALVRWPRSRRGGGGGDRRELPRAVSGVVSGDVDARVPHQLADSRGSATER